MVEKEKNQKDNIDQELINSFGIDYIFDSKPINRIKNKPTIENTNFKLNALKEKINNINNCDLKNNGKQIVFSDGNSKSPIMIIGETPGEAEDDCGFSFQGEVGPLLKKMLLAIDLDINKIYKTYSINFRTPEDRKPTTKEIKRYSPFLKDHVSIIDPKIIILMGSTAMESIINSNNKISVERGKWKEIILKSKTYPLMITYSPSYLLRYPENKKYSWEDLKKIKKKIQELNINI